jgi:hypothetical protein
MSSLVYIENGDKDQAVTILNIKPHQNIILEDALRSYEMSFTMYLHDNLNHQLLIGLPGQQVNRNCDNMYTCCRNFC